jgi:hypothetical protein
VSSRNFDAAGIAPVAFRFCSRADKQWLCCAISFNRVGLTSLREKRLINKMVFGQPLLSNCSMSVFRKYSKVTWTVLRLFDRPALLFCFHKTAA